MASISLPYTLTPGTPENVSQLNANLNTIVNAVNGGLDGDNVSASTGQQLGLSSTAAMRRGITTITAEESVTSTTFATLTTPDQVSNIVLPSSGLLAITYQAMWKHSTGANFPSAAIFIGSNQLTGYGGSGPAASSASPSAIAADQYTYLTTITSGLTTGSTTTAYSGDVTTGQVIQPLFVFAAAGTYSVSVRFKVASGSVSAKNRTLRVWTVGF